jgi:hypothetical protein
MQAADAPDAAVTRLVRRPGADHAEGIGTCCTGINPTASTNDEFFCIPIDWSHHVRCYPDRTGSPFRPAG